MQILPIGVEQEAMLGVLREQGVSTISPSDYESGEEENRTINQLTTTLKSLHEWLSYSQNLNNEVLCKLLFEAISNVETLKLATQNRQKILAFLSLNE